MSEVSLQIDGKDVTATDDMSVLDAAKSAGISIPTVCHHEKLKPFGGCRLCTVEAQAGDRTTLVAACVYPVQQVWWSEPVPRRSTRFAKCSRSSCWPTLRSRRSCRPWPRNITPIRTVSQKRLHSASCAACASDIAPRSSRSMPSASWTAVPRANQLHPGDRRPRVLGLQGMLSALPDIGIAGRLCVDEIAGTYFSHGARPRAASAGKFRSGTKSEQRISCSERRDQGPAAGEREGIGR